MFAPVSAVWVVLVRCCGCVCAHAWVCASVWLLFVLCVHVPPPCVRACMHACVRAWVESMLLCGDRDGGEGRWNGGGGELVQLREACSRCVCAHDIAPYARDRLQSWYPEAADPQQHSTDDACALGVLHVATGRPEEADLMAACAIKAALGEDLARDGTRVRAMPGILVPPPPCSRLWCFFACGSLHEACVLLVACSLLLVADCCLLRVCCPAARAPAVLQKADVLWSLNPFALSGLLLLLVLTRRSGDLADALQLLERNATAVMLDHPGAATSLQVCVCWAAVVGANIVLDFLADVRFRSWSYAFRAFMCVSKGGSAMCAVKGRIVSPPMLC